MSPPFVQVDAASWRGLTQASGAMCMRIAALLVVAMALACCTQRLDFQLPTSQPLKLAIYKDGAPLKTCTIVPSSRQFHQLQALLASDPNGWSPSLVTFVPSVYITGNGFSVNFLESSVIFNSGHRQLAHRISKASYAFLTCEPRI